MITLEGIQNVGKSIAYCVCNICDTVLLSQFGVNDIILLMADIYRAMHDDRRRAVVFVRWVISLFGLVFRPKSELVFSFGLSD